jgi:hypothetical protein
VNAGEINTTAKKLIQVAPYFPPDVEGLGEFALHLGDALLKQSDIHSDFIIWRAQKDVGTVPIATDHPIERLIAPTAHALKQALNSRLRQTSAPTLLLHYTSYSYSKEGLAWWLPGVLREFKAQGGRVVCFFHELYAKGRFPNKTWMGAWLQKRIFRQILALSDAAITSNEGYLDELQRNNAHSIPLQLTAIGSNVGELNAPKPFATRHRRLVIFGLWITRLLLYERHMDGIKKLAEILQIDEIADVGNIDDFTPMLTQAKSELGDRMKIYGRLPAAEISSLLADSMIGVANYDYALRSKSGVVAAYQAHALPCLLFPSLGETSTRGLSDECLSAVQFFATPQTELMGLLAKASDAGFADYQNHRSFDAIARKIEPLLWT